MRKQKTSHSAPSLRLWFFSGVALFAIGIMGLAYSVYYHFFADLPRLVSDEALVFIEAHVRSSDVDSLEETLGEDILLHVLESIATPHLGLPIDERWETFLGSRTGVVLLPEGEFLLATRPRSSGDAEDFFRSLATPGEEIRAEKTPYATILTPAYSSSLAYTTYRGWVFFGTSRDAIMTLWNTNPRLSDNRGFTDIDEDISRESAVRGFINIEHLAESAPTTLLSGGGANAPLLQAFSRMIPSAGFSIDPEQGSVRILTKFLTHPGIHNTQEIQKTPGQTLPEISLYSPQAPLFFINGAEIYSQYQHTRDFLASLHPQFSAVFEGLIRAQSGRIFGQDFDFDADFLAHMHGQYGIILDFENDLFPFVSFTFVTGYGGADIEQNLSRLHSAIRHAQGHFVPTVETVELPDGTERRELVAVRPEDIPIRVVESEAGTYYTAESDREGEKFSYGFLGNRLVFSSHEVGLQKVYNAFTNPDVSLNANEDFRSSVLWRYAPSQSYGAVQISKLLPALDLLWPEDPEHPRTMISLLGEALRSATFARRSAEGAVYWQVTLFGR